MLRTSFAILLIILPLVGCYSDSGQNLNGQTKGKFNRARASTPDAARPVALLNGKPVHLTDLAPGLTEAAGGLILSEWVLAGAIEKGLSKQGLSINQDHLDLELDILRLTLATDPDQAQKLLNQVVKSRGLGSYRFEQMLRRNAGLRLLIHKQVKVTPAALKQTYDMEYGPRYQLRLIVVSTLLEASDLVRKAKAGQSFSDLATQYSIDPSLKQGGLLSAMSGADVTYPKSIRDMMTKLKVGQISGAIALEKGFAILRLEQKIEAKPVEFDDVKDELSERVRRRLEQIHMQRLARQLLAQADLQVLDRQLKASWDQSREKMLQGN
jgi:foldase protein PrsA